MEYKLTSFSSHKKTVHIVAQFTLWAPLACIHHLGYVWSLWIIVIKCVESLPHSFMTHGSPNTIEAHKQPPVSAQPDHIVGCVLTYTPEPSRTTSHYDMQIADHLDSNYRGTYHPPVIDQPGGCSATMNHNN